MTNDHIALSRPGRGRHVLLAEDDPVQNKFARLLLTQGGFRVTVARNGREALDRLRVDRPDAILSDVQMPEMDGLALCRAVKIDPATASIPVVLVSSYYLENADRDVAAKAGASALLARTPSLQEALRILTEILDGRGPADPQPDLAAFDAARGARAARALERSAAVNVELGRRLADQSALLGAVSTISDAVSGDACGEPALHRALRRMLDLSGVSSAAIYLKSETGELQCAANQGFTRDAMPPVLTGECPPVQRVLDTCQTVAVAMETALCEGCVAVPQSFACNLVLAPLMCRGASIGFLAMGVDPQQATLEQWRHFARAVGVDLGQAIGLERASSRLVVADERYRTLMEGASDGIFVLTPQGVILEANRRAEELYGLPRDRIVGRHISELVPQPSVAHALEAFDRAIEQGGEHGQVVPILRGDGTSLEVEFSTRLIRLDGDDVVLSIARDITARLKLEEQLRQSQKLEAIGQLTGGIAHDFNNILAVILAHANMLQETLAETDPRREEADGIAAAAIRAAALTRQLLTFARRQEVKLGPVDLNVVAAGIEKMLHRLLGKDVRLTAVLAPDLGVVRADAGQLEQVLMNLSINARDAMPGGGQLTIETANVELDESFADAHAGVAPGPYVRLTVSDTGTGMDPETLRRVFEPFFTTKGPGRGTGLGLSTCYGIVKQSGGHMFAQSEPGRGTVFTVYLPREGAAPTRSERPSTVAPVRARPGETVLLVEHDPQVRRVIDRMLRGCGYAVILASQGPEALDLCVRYDGNIDAIVADGAIPGMSGTEMLGALRARCPDAAVLFLTDGTDDPRRRQGAPCDARFIAKPFDLDDFARLIRETIDCKTAAQRAGSASTTRP